MGPLPGALLKYLPAKLSPAQECSKELPQRPAAKLSMETRAWKATDRFLGLFASSGTRPCAVLAGYQMTVGAVPLTPLGNKGLFLQIEGST